MSDLIGKIVCGYRITDAIGEGGMGKVYLAESAFLTEYKQQVAIKTLTTYTTDERQVRILRGLFAREANIQVQFDHPHIVSVIQFAVEGEQHFLILEYMPGYWHRGHRITNVADMIAHETGPIPQARALKLFAQALEAMSYAHNFRYRWEGEERVGIVHRDIKPANLLLQDAQTVKVSDFGIVKVQQRGGTVTQNLTPGTSAYMSPEAILGPQHFKIAELDTRSDIYSLGVTLYEMLCGRLPFEPEPGSNRDLSLRRKHVHEAPVPPSTFYPALPPEVDAVVLRALEKRPERRYQTAAEFRQAILALGGRPAPAPAARDEKKGSSLDTQPFETVALNPDAGTSMGVVATTVATPSDPLATVPIPAAPTPREFGAEVQAPERSRRLAYLVVAAALVCGTLATAAVIMIPQLTGQGRNVVALPTPAPPPPSATPAPTPVPPVPPVSPPAVPEGMVTIPGGGFLMGRDLSAAEQRIKAPDNAGHLAEVFSFSYPAHQVSVRPFHLDVTEVSNRDYARFVSEARHGAPPGWSGGAPPTGAEDLPVTNVTYNDAVEYCAWRGKARGDGVSYRLPTEEEWELAARGTGEEKARTYPWGNVWKPGLANTRESRLAQPQIVTANRDGASPFGVLNMCGNAAEWTATDFKHYPGSDRPTPREKGYAGAYQVVRGGSFDYVKEWGMTTTRAWARPTVKAPNIGFRCAADAHHAAP